MDPRRAPPTTSAPLPARNPVIKANAVKREAVASRCLSVLRNKPLKFR